MHNNQHERVIWREGMLISPQHLQQQELHEAELVHARIAAIVPTSWGVNAVELDLAALAAGRVELVRLEAILPDGAVLRGRPSVPSRSFAERFTSTAERLVIRVGLPLLREGAGNFHAADSEWRGRYAASTRTVGDIVTSKSTRTIEVGSLAPVLLFDDEGDEDYVALEIAELVRAEDGGYRVSDSHVPPLLRLAASPVLTAAWRELLSLSVAKQRALTSTRRQRDAATVEFAAADVTRYLLLHAINAHLPRLKHLGEAARVAPVAAYEALLDYAGALTSFSSEVDPAGFPRFVATDLRACFLPLCEAITRMLGAVVKDASVGIPLEARDDGMWIGRLADARMLECRDWVLAVECEAHEQTVANELPKLSKVSSWKAIGAIVKSATPGVPLVPIHRPPPEVVIRPGQVYFLIDKADGYWREVLDERTVAVYVPPPFDPSRARLRLLGIPRGET